MTLASARASVVFWSGSGSWSAGQSGVNPTVVSLSQQQAVLSWIDQIYASASGAALLERASGAGKLRVGGQARGGAAAYIGDEDPWVGINFEHPSKFYWFNSTGQYVRGDFDLVLAHELSHLVDETRDPNLDNPTDTMQNAASWIADGDAVKAQNRVALETGRLDKVRLSYNATMLETDARHPLLVQGVSYTAGKVVEIARLGSGISNNQDHTARSDASDDLIFGLDGDDLIKGADGDDHLYGGHQNDHIFGGSGDDRLFGEYGNDILTGDVGVDLLHGGFNSAVNPGLNRESDGSDTADYSVFAGSASGLGVAIGLIVTPWDQTHSALSDFSAATFVRDLARDNGVDTLISIEKIIGTVSDDRLVIERFNVSRLSGPDQTGGLWKVDLGDESDTASQGGDVLDVGLLNVAAWVDLGAAQPFVSARIDAGGKTKLLIDGVERVVGSSHGDLIKGKGRGLLEGGAGTDRIEAYAGDVVVGGSGGDEFHFFTDRLNFAGTFEQGQTIFDNKILVLGFDANDKIFVDGIRYTGFTETGRLEGGYYADEVGAWVYDYVEERSGSLWNGDGNSFEFGTTGHWNRSDLPSNAGITLNDCFKLKLYGGSGKYLEIEIADFQPTEGGINFRMASHYVDPPDYGSYTQHVGYSNGYNIANPAVIPHNPIATYEEIWVQSFDLQSWLPSLPTDMANYTAYVGMLG